MKRILITGRDGFIGASLAQYFARFPEVYAAETLKMRGHTPEEYDFSGADAIVHTAAIVHQRETKKTRPLFDAVNCELTAAIAGKAKREGVKQFVFFSTIGVFGMVEGVITDESVPAPRTRYERSKLEAERRIAELADDSFSVTIVRAPVVFGPGEKGNPAKLNRLSKKLPFCPDYKNRRTMVSIETLCAATKALVDEPRSGIFYPKEREPVSTCDLIERAMREQGRTPKRSKLLNPLIRVLRACTRVGKKAFGDLVYEGAFARELPASDGKEANR